MIDARLNGHEIEKIEQDGEVRYRCQLCHKEESRPEPFTRPPACPKEPIE